MKQMLLGAALVLAGVGGGVGATIALRPHPIVAESDETSSVETTTPEDVAAAVNNPLNETQDYSESAAAKAAANVTAESAAKLKADMDRAQADQDMRRIARREAEQVRLEHGESY